MSHDIVYSTGTKNNRMGKIKCQIGAKGKN